jgi:hypothetical protein
MRLITKYFRRILFAVLIIFCWHQRIFSQEADSSTFKQHGLFIGIGLGPSLSQIVNTGTLSVSELVSGKKNSFFGSVEIGYFFSKYFGLSSGISFNLFSSQLTLNSFQNNVNSFDSENELYELRVSGSDIREQQKIGYLSIPLFLNLRLPFGKTVGFFLQPGVNLAIPLIKTFQSIGTFTYKGYYPAYNVLLENLPDYGLSPDLSSETEGNLELNPTSFNAVISAGWDFFIQKKFQIAIVASYEKSLSGISKYSAPDNFQLSTGVNQINSLMGGSSNTTAQSLGIKIIFRYYPKKKKVENLRTYNSIE